MASVFVSYDREDLNYARPIAAALEKSGHSVWWDRNIKGGAQYSKEIEKALKAADAVVVLWSERSVESAWVRDEAASARDSGRLVPATLDSAEPPLGFRQYQTIDLSKCKGRGKTVQLRTLMDAVETLDAGRTGQTNVAPVGQSPGKHYRRAPFAALIALLVIGGAALFVWRPWSSGPAVPIVAVAPADQTAADDELARDLLVQLGGARAASSGALQLVGNADLKDKPQLVFEVGGDHRAGQVKASVVLLDGRDRSLLWSKAFEQPADKLSDLRQQLAFTSARVLECALEGVDADKSVERQTLKIYLTTCSTYAQGSSEDEMVLAAALNQVTRKAPQLKGAWAKLLSVEDRLVSNIDRDSGVTKQTLAAHIAAARRVHPKLPEALLAEASLAPPDAFGSRMSFLEQALQAEPENAEAAAAYSNYLRTVGRMQQSVEQARRAANLDPLSPTARDLLVTALTHDGQVDAALEELRRAEQLWPGASVLADARYRLHLRYGDANEALRMHRLGQVSAAQKGQKFFLEARLNPTRANVDELLTTARRGFQRDRRVIVGFGQVLGIFGREEELIRILLNWPDRQSVDLVADVLFRPALEKVRRDPRMIPIAARIGLLHYWQSTGKWPDFCLDPRLPYDCKAEAAKYGRRP